MGKVGVPVMACKSTYKWNFANLEKVSEPSDNPDSGTFADL
jgi:hypothetical protein